MIKEFIKKHAIVKQIFLYGIIGLIASGTDSVCFIGMNHYGINKYVSNFLSINIGILISFLLNTYINFKMTSKIGQRVISFFAIGYLGMLLSMIILYIGCDILGGTTTVIKIISIFIVATFQFILNKSITYRKGN